jgi:hypothetical protein
VHEGNTARALFYIETMYAEDTGDGWFTPQMRTLYDWSYLDPADQAEYDRTFRVASFQSDRPNPFILDSTLIRRAFFPEIVAAGEPTAAGASLLRVAPTVFSTSALVSFTPAASGLVTVDVFDALGRRVMRLFEGPAFAGTPLSLRIPAAGIAPGVLLVRASMEGGRHVARVVRR